MNAAELFTEVYGHAPAGVWSAPGRVNLIGEHTDYNNGLVLPFAISSRAELAAELTDDGVVSVVSAQQGDVVHTFPVAELAPGTAAATGWPAYVLGAVWVLIRSGHTVPGLRCALSSTVPAGAGLSSSAAIECATVLAVSDLLGLALTAPEIAVLAQRDENDFVGVPCGLMDQMASAVCTAGHALYFDVGENRSEQVPFDPAAENLTVLVLDTQVSHELTDGEYAKRRASCEQAAAELGIASLRQLETVDLPRAESVLSSELLFRRVRHIVTENARVRETVTRLRAGAIADIGPEMVASHISLRDDFEVSDPALDLAVDTAMKAGAIGARMTGGGFGGSAIAVTPDHLVESLSAAVYAAFAAADRRAPILRQVLPSAGASRDS